ncbi:hypothetical protein RRG08_020550 [Elysia crispata]|uniref:Uncharacterized protein n=1 Tax=Elysia crispata TaxID=231223 RepID=A0AAE1DUA6_9GAST|nr:hypothetical protein RRG08_020550 [Elysia crispata]
MCETGAWHTVNHLFHRVENLKCYISTNAHHQAPIETSHFGRSTKQDPLLMGTTHRITGGFSRLGPATFCRQGITTVPPLFAARPPPNKRQLYHRAMLDPEN